MCHRCGVFCAGVVFLFCSKFCAIRICGLFVRFKCCSLGFGQLLFLRKISKNCSLAHLLLVGLL